RAVLADQAQDLTFAQLEIDVVDRGNAPEPFGHARALEHHGRIDWRLRAKRLWSRDAQWTLPLRLRVWSPFAARALNEHRPEDVGPLEQLERRAGEAELALLHEHRPPREAQRDVH